MKRMTQREADAISALAELAEYTCQEGVCDPLMLTLAARARAAVQRLYRPRRKGILLKILRKPQ